MLSQEEVLRLQRELTDTRVLSVYLDAEAHDPAKRRAWRVRFDQLVRDLETRLEDAPAEEREGLGTALELIRAELSDFDGYLPDSGWVGYATPDRLVYGSSIRVPMPDLIAWEKGTRVSPYIRALKQSRPISVIVADQRHARILQYHYGTLEEQEVLHSDLSEREGAPDGSAKRAGGRSGMRGEPRTDAARKSSETSTRRLVRDIADRFSGGLGGGFLVVGGSSEMVRQVLAALPTTITDRAAELGSVQVDASDSQLLDAVETAASELSRRVQTALVEEILNASRGDGRGSLGLERTERALQAGAVDTLVLTREFARQDPARAERLVDTALDSGATVEELGEEIGSALDREGGVGARLRYTV